MDWVTLAAIATVFALIVAIVVGWFTIRNHKREAAIVAILAIVFILGVGHVVMKLKSDPTEAEPLIPSPTFTPVITPTSTPMLPTSTPQPPTSTPAPTPTATPIPSYSLTINGITVQQGQNIVHVPNGNVSLFPIPGPNGKYPFSTVVHLTATPNLAETTIIWGGTDSLPSPQSTVASVTMWADKFVTLTITPPTPTSTPIPPTSTPTQMPIAPPVPTATPTFTPSPTPTNTPMPTSTPTPQPTATLVPTSVPQPTSTPIPTTPTPTPAPAPAPVFEADFEDGQAEADLLFIEDGGTWQVVSDETGNKVYETNNFDEKEDWSNVKFGSDSWENYVVEYSIKIPEFQPNPFDFQASIAIRRDSAGPTNYTQVLSLHPEKQTKLVYSQAGDWYEPENQITSYIFSQNFIKGEWYSFRIEAQGERIRVFLKDQNGQYNLIIDVEDPKLTKGHLRFSVTPGTYAQFDNIRVYSLSTTAALDSAQVHPDASKISH